MTIGSGDFSLKLLQRVSHSEIKFGRCIRDEPLLVVHPLDGKLSTIELKWNVHSQVAY